MTKQRRHALLSWKLLEYKLMYYRPDLVDERHHKKLTVSDARYDHLEDEYVTLGLGLKASIRLSSHHAGTEDTVVGFPLDLPCGRCVLEKFKKRKGPKNRRRKQSPLKPEKPERCAPEFKAAMK